HINAHMAGVRVDDALRSERCGVASPSRAGETPTRLLAIEHDTAGRPVSGETIDAPELSKRTRLKRLSLWASKVAQPPELVPGARAAVMRKWRSDRSTASACPSPRLERRPSKWGV